MGGNFSTTGNVNTGEKPLRALPVSLASGWLPRPRSELNSLSAGALEPACLPCCRRR